MNSRALIVVFLIAATALAGCGGKTPPVITGTTTKPPLASDKGAINGLIIDDVYRPVGGALVLVQKIGATATTDSSGQFFITDLDPGAYILQVQADGHASAPRNVEIRAGEYSEVEITADRLSNNGPRIATSQYSIFMTCTVELVVVAGNGLNCLQDQSGDSERTGIYTNLTGLANVTAMVTEVVFNQIGDYDFDIAIDDTGDGVLDRYWAESTIIKGDRTKITLFTNTTNENQTAGRNLKWMPYSDTFFTTVFPHGEFYSELHDNAGTYGVGADVAIRGTIIQSVFLGAPAQPLDTYCTITCSG